MLKRWLLYLGSVILGLGLVGALLGALVLALLWPTLPSLEALTDYQPKIPLRVVSAEGDLLGEFGEERRAIVTIKAVPDVMKQAILAAEDERFYQHGGVDYLSVLRAAMSNVATGTQQGAGTITMQVARNFFLTREKTLTRKLREVLARLEDRGQSLQRRNPRALCEPDFPRAACLRVCRRVPDLLRTSAQGRHGSRGGHAGRSPEGAVGLQPGH